MLEWIASNLSSIVTVAVCVLLIGIVTLIIASLIKDKKISKSSCCGGCAKCAMSGACHKK